MIQRAFICLCDQIEYALSRWWGATAYAATILLTPFLDWPLNDRWTYLTNALLMLLLIGNARRSDKAMHLKLDEIDPKPEHNALEMRDELEMSN